jgi:hypothetical protein
VVTTIAAEEEEEEMGVATVYNMAWCGSEVEYQTHRTQSFIHFWSNYFLFLSIKMKAVSNMLFALWALPSLISAAVLPRDEANINGTLVLSNLILYSIQYLEISYESFLKTYLESVELIMRR